MTALIRSELIAVRTLRTTYIVRSRCWRWSD